MSENYVQLAPDSTGKKIRVDQRDVTEIDGTTSTVEMQVVRLAEGDVALLNSLVIISKIQLATLILIANKYNIDQDSITQLAGDL